MVRVRPEKQTYPFPLRKITCAAMLRPAVLQVGQVLYPSLVTIHSHIITDIYLGTSAPRYDHALVLRVTYCTCIISKILDLHDFCLMFALNN